MVIWTLLSCPHLSCLKGGCKLSDIFKKFQVGKFNWQESYPSLILGAIIVVILGLLVANYISRKDKGEIDMGEQTVQTIEQAMAPKAGAQYTVRQNDSLSKISETVYGSQDNWMAIAKANNIVNPNRILVGSKLQLPAKEAVAQEPTVTVVTSYDVVAGDTYFTIAEKVYGNGSRWRDLDRANGMRRLPNGNPLVFAGTTIVVPR